MHVGQHAVAHPDKPAVVVVGTDRVVTYRELEESSCRLAHFLATRGIGPGSVVAALLDNDPRYFDVAFAAFRSGCYFVPINWHLGAEEAGYIVEDSGADALITSASFADLAASLAPHLANVGIRLSVDGGIDGFESLDDALAAQLPTPLDDELEGTFMLYSSGTTGRPKGVKPPLTGAPFGGATPLEGLVGGLFGFDESVRFLSPAPLYHAAPLGWSLATLRLGGTVVLMPRFDAGDTLRTIERHAVTHAQFVPTHFVRMLKLPEPERTVADLSTLRMVVHAAAPCPVEVKRQMLDWWGPIISEFYSGSEGLGFCMIGPEEWLEHPGSVGRPVIGVAHILGDDGAEVGAGEIGTIYFDGPWTFEYHNDPEKTASVFEEHGWGTLGDVGYLDADGYLHLTDRVSHMIISGGVNIYPQEVEDVLVTHPDVADVAVIGVPDPDFGESVKAVVEPADRGMLDGDARDLERALIEYCRERIAHYKCPRTVDFVAELPRLPTGKLLKRKLRDRYAAD